MWWSPDTLRDPLAPVPADPHLGSSGAPPLCPDGALCATPPARPVQTGPLGPTLGNGLHHAIYKLPWRRARATLVAREESLLIGDPGRLLEASAQPGAGSSASGRRAAVRCEAGVAAARWQPAGVSQGASPLVRLQPLSTVIANYPFPACSANCFNLFVRISSCGAGSRPTISRIFFHR